MLSRDYTSIAPSGNAPGMETQFPKDAKQFSFASFSLISGLACYNTTPNGGQIAVADELKNKVFIFNPDGSKKHVVGYKGSGDGEFSSPKNICTSLAGKLLVADSGNHRIQSFDKLGQVYQSKWQAHPHEIKKGRQPHEFDTPSGCCFVTPPTSDPSTKVEKDVSNLGFEVAKKDDGLDYGSDDDWDPEVDGNVLANFKNEAPPPKSGEWYEQEEEKVVRTPHPDILIADTMNNRIQYIPDNAAHPPITFGTTGEALDQFKGPEDVAYHDNISDWDFERYDECKEYRNTGVNWPYWYLGDKNRMAVYDSLTEAPIGSFKIIKASQPGTWRLLHITKESYKLADVDEKVIKLRTGENAKRGTFIVNGDVRSDGHPKVYNNLLDLVVDGGKLGSNWLELNSNDQFLSGDVNSRNNVNNDNRRCNKIAVADTGNHRVTILGFVKPTYIKESGVLSVLFPHRIKVLNVLGTGSKSSSHLEVCHMNSPNSLDYNKHGDLIVNDSGHWRVCIFSPDEELIHVIGGRLELKETLGRPLCCSFGRDHSGNESLLIGYQKGYAKNYGLPKPVIKGDMGHLPRSATLNAFSYLDFVGAANAGICCKLFYQIFSELRRRWDLYPLNPNVFNRIKQIFVDWSTVQEGIRIPGHLKTRDRWVGGNERGTSIEWWMENYKRGRGGREENVGHNLTLQIEAENRRREKAKVERERLKKGGCKYKKEDLSSDLIRNCSKIDDLKEMIRCLDLTYTLQTDWRWVVLNKNEEDLSKAVVEKRKEKFIKYLLVRYMRPKVVEEMIKSSRATIDFDNGVRCAICDLCGLPFWWKWENVLRVIFESMAEAMEREEFDDVRTRACETTRVPRKVVQLRMDYTNFLDFMTTVAEKNMSLRDWTFHRGIQKFLRDNRGASVPKSRVETTLPMLVKNTTFDYQVSSCINFVDKMFARGEFEDATYFPVTKIDGCEIDDEVEDDEQKRWERIR
ncbi:hypothetical protein TrVE_jg2086 [Triparma verrucosa]|uniref:Uncharacterized protein n=1 Tax=Triparma verrucosa TaxID=1606542 RepID=A0A9W7CIK4_9STRA|nr:hypothetical protein TrVE_jg2086 [Triparma verrucosa]